MGVPRDMGAYAFYVARERPEGDPKNGWEPQEKIWLDDCIRAYTSGSAYSSSRKRRKVN